MSDGKSYLQEALTLAELGWHVFPLVRGDKTPLVREWQRGATTAPHQVREWWERSPLANIAVACGLSGVVVIDLDVKNGVNGPEAWEALCRKLGIPSNGTATVATPSGGRHLYFAAPEGAELRNSAGKLGLGIDVRANGGYVVAPPSATEQGEYVWLNTDALAPLPQEIVDLLTRKPAQRSPAPPPRGSTTATGDHSRYVQAAVDAELAKLREAREGVRNDTLNEVAFSLGTLVGAPWASLSRAGVENDLLSIARGIGLGETEARKTIRSGLDAGIAQPRPEPERPAFPVGKRSEDPPSLQGTTVPPVSVHEQLRAAEWSVVKNALCEEEYGDAKLLVHVYNDRLLYDHSGKAWYLWNGHYWKRDRVGLVKRLLAGQVASQYIHHAADMTKKLASETGENKQAKMQDTIDQLLKRAKSLCKIRRTKNILEFAQSLVGITGDEWDSDPWLLGVENGVVDLRTGDLRPGQPDDYIRTVAPTKYQGPNTPCPQWETFIQEVLARDKDGPVVDHGLVSYVQRLLGYGLTGLSSEHVFPILWGSGRNGKDTLLETLAAVLGPQACPVSKDVLMLRNERAGAATPHLMDLQGRRLVWASETSEGEWLNTGLVKYATGGGTIKGRELYEGMREFVPTHLLVLITNSKPRAPADDQALWDRVSLIPFIRRFVDDPVKPNERKRIPNLTKQLQEEASGILAWLVRGCLAWQKHGMSPPERVKLATQEYRQDEDTLGQFIEECCVTTVKDAQVGASELYAAYREWVERMGIDNQLPGNKFGEKISFRFERKRTSRGNVYIGLGLLSGPA